MEKGSGMQNGRGVAQPHTTTNKVATFMQSMQHILHLHLFVNACVWHFAALQGKINPLALINLPSAILITKNTEIQQYFNWCTIYFFFLLKNTDIPHLHKKKQNKNKYFTPTNDPATLVFKNLLTASVRFYSLPTAVQKNTWLPLRLRRRLRLQLCSEPAKQRCDANCKNVNNNNSVSNCSIHNNKQGEATEATALPDNQTSIESRTKGVSLAPQTHSGPTGPPEATLETVTEESSTEISTATTTATTTTTTTTTAETKPTTTTEAAKGTAANESTTGSGAGQSVSSSSSCSNKATVQRQRRLRTPVWARSMSTNKTYLKMVYTA